MKRLSLPALLLVLTSCKPAAPPPAPAQPPAVVAKEGDLITVVLTPEAEKRLGIVTAPVEFRPIERTRMLGGDVQVPPGRSAAVAAPMAGTIGGTPAVAGRRVRRGETVFTLTPLLSAESRASFAAARIDAEGALEGAKVQLAAAMIAFDRADRLLQDKAGSQRAVDEARAQRDSAQAAVKAAETRRDLLANAVAGTLGPVPLEAPFDGMLRKVLAAPGEAVTAGTPLYELADLRRLWVRVPVYVGDLRRVDATKELLVEGLAAKPVAAPPSADPLAATADLFYEVDDKDGALRPGQKVMVPLPLKGADESLVAPWSSILHDINGGTWVYEKIAERKYARRRVQVSAVVDRVAVLVGAVKAGTLVVTEGVPELFGTEFGHAR